MALAELPITVDRREISFYPGCRNARSSQNLYIPRLGSHRTRTKPENKCHRKNSKSFHDLPKEACSFFFFFGRQMVCLRVLEYFQGARFREHLCREKLCSPRGPEEGSPLLNFWTWVLGWLGSCSHWGTPNVNPKDGRRNNHRNHNHTNYSVVLSTTNHKLRLRRGATACQRNSTGAIPCERHERCRDHTFKCKPIELILLQQYLGKKYPI